MAGLREWFSQIDDSDKRLPVMVKMSTNSVSLKINKKVKNVSVSQNPSLDHMHGASMHSTMMDEYSEEDEEFQSPDYEQEVSGFLFKLVSNFAIFSR